MKADEIKKVLSEARPGDHLFLTFREIDFPKDVGDFSIWTSIDYLIAESRCGSFKISENQLGVLVRAMDRFRFAGTMNRRVELEVTDRFDAPWVALIVARNLERAEILGARPLKINKFDRREEFPTRAVTSFAAAIMFVFWLFLT